MRAAVGVYNTHDEAIDAINILNDANFPIQHLSIIGILDTEVVDKHMRLSPENPIKLGGIEVGTTLGITLGVLTGVGIMAIPGVGFIYGAGALAGAVAGFDAGLIGGGVSSVIETLVSKNKLAKKYKADLEAGRFLLVVKGTNEEMALAKEILNNHNSGHEIEVHHED